MSASDPGLIRAIRGPITLITVGVLFALNNFTPYHFDQTWPVLLIVFGLLSLLRRGAPAAPRNVGPGPNTWPTPPSAYPPGSYRQSQYPGNVPPGPAGPGSTPPASGGPV
jgi:hypothetical protein